MKCPHCSKDISEQEILKEAARIQGRRTSKAKADAARANAKKGGWPKGKPRKKKGDSEE